MKQKICLYSYVDLNTLTHIQPDTPIGVEPTSDGIRL